MHTCISSHGLKRSWRSCPRRVNASNKKHTQHAPSMKTECDYLNGWIKKRSHTQKSHPKVVNPRDIAGERKKKKKKKVLHSYPQVLWNSGNLFSQRQRRNSWAADCKCWHSTAAVFASPPLSTTVAVGSTLKHQSSMFCVWLRGTQVQSFHSISWHNWTGSLYQVITVENPICEKCGVEKYQNSLSKMSKCSTQP